jgi:outer membrane biosynthesis protein TonB
VSDRHGEKRLESRPQRDDCFRAMKTLLITTFATVLLVGCGAQPAQEPTKPDPATEAPTIVLAPPTPEVQTLTQPTPEPKPTAQVPAQPTPESQPAEPAAPKTKPAKWEAAKQNNWEAARNGRIEVIKQLLADGMNIEMPDKEGLTAMYRAANNDQKATVLFLLENGADPNTRDKWGNTPLDVTLSGDVEKLLRQHGGKTAEELKAGGN